MTATRSVCCCGPVTARGIWGRSRATCRCNLAALADGPAVAEAVRRARPEWVFHLATHGAHSSQTDVTEIATTNVHGAISLVEAEPLEPNSQYAAMKALATLYCQYTARQRGIHVPTLRL